ncbi:MAG TPA: DUF3568 family protein [Planctomycetota bacterium]|nr:DUF3568 family protein [Planctomycetota bacterium]
MRTVLTATLLLAAAACDAGKPAITPTTSDLGTGLNTVERKYPRSVAEVLKAATGAVKELSLRVESEKADALGGEIVAKRATDDKVTVTVKSVDSSHTSVSVRVAPGDRNMSNAVHEKIASALGLEASPADAEASTSLHSQPLAACVTAAEKSLKTLHYEIVDRQVGEEGAELKGRASDSQAAGFRFRKAADGRTEAILSSGSRERRDQLKAEFEKALSGS